MRQGKEKEVSSMETEIAMDLPLCDKQRREKKRGKGVRHG